MPKDKFVCLSTAYAAPITYYQAIINAKAVLTEQYENYAKQSYRNRCQIVTENGVTALSIPVEKPNSGKALTKDIMISAHGDWQSVHWKTIESAYNSSAYFEYYTDDLLPFYTKKWKYLLDFNLDLQNKILELLDIEITTKKTNIYLQKLDCETEDLREAFHPKRNTDTFTFIPYYQVFKARFGFIPNCSIYDLLFNMGNESQLILQTKN